MSHVRSFFASLWNITIDDGLIQTVRGVFGHVESRDGVTTYDEDTGDPYCIKVKGGSITTEPGACGDAQVQIQSGTGGGSDDDITAPASPSADVSPLVSASPSASPSVSPAPIAGCTDHLADNYNPDATQDDQSCTYPSVSPSPDVSASPSVSPMP
jgi:hypothetical protein